jgi:hypothetical protein
MVTDNVALSSYHQAARNNYDIEIYNFRVSLFEHSNKK